MAELTQRAQDLALRAIFSGDMTIALTRGGEEITDLGYQAQPFEVTAPMSLQGTDARIITNSSLIRFGPWEESGDAPEGYQLRASGGAVLAAGATVGEVVRVRQGLEFTIQPRKIILGLRA